MNNDAINYLLPLKNNKQNLTAFNNELTDILCSNKSSDNLSLIIKTITDMLKELEYNNKNNIYIEHILSIALEALLPYLKNNPKFKTHLLALYTYDLNKIESQKLPEDVSINIKNAWINSLKIKTPSIVKKELLSKHLKVQEFRNSNSTIYTIYTKYENNIRLIEQFKSYAEVEVFLSRYGNF